MIVYESHAREQMRARGVTESNIRLTLEDPDRVRPAIARPPNPPCEIYERSIEGRVCKVYVRKDSNPPVVATTAWRNE